jgi:ketosteroid isomerase-like protein
MTDDYILMMPGQEPMEKAAFAVFCKGLQGTRIHYSTIRIEELQVLGDWAYMRCRFETMVTPSGCSPVRCTGHTLDILRKQPDGRWLIAREANLVAL